MLDDANRDTVDGQTSENAGLQERNKEVESDLALLRVELEEMDIIKYIIIYIKYEVYFQIGLVILNLTVSLILILLQK